MTAADVVIVGGGPAGLSAAIELRRRGGGRVVVLEREQQVGGVPRYTEHLGYGMRDLHRVTTGPRYAALLTRRAEKAGVEIEVGRTVQSIAGHTVETTGESGPSALQARAVVLATGVRERARAARLVPGDRPAGVLTTGSLQQFTRVRGRRVGNVAVVVGAEHVSFSAVATLAHAGCAVAAMVTPLAHHQTYGSLRALTATRHRVPVLAGVGVAEVIGRTRVEAVQLTDGSRIACDTVVFTGDWIPDHELARRAGLAMVQGSRAPAVGPEGHTEQRGLFAIGNLVHPVETADVCAIDGRCVATSVMDWLSLATWPDSVTSIAVTPPLLWAAPIAGATTLRVADFVAGSIELRRGDEVVHRTRRREWIPNRAIHLPVAGVTSAVLHP